MSAIVLPIIAGLIAIPLSVALGISGNWQIVVILLVYCVLELISELERGRCYGCGEVRLVGVFERN